MRAQAEMVYYRQIYENTEKRRRVNRWLAHGHGYAWRIIVQVVSTVDWGLFFALCL